MTPEDAANLLLRNMPQGIDLTLVGGRAVEYWVLVYQEFYPDEFDGQTVATTEDADFVVQEREAAKRCFQHWEKLLKDAGYKPSLDYPPTFSPTVELAVLRVEHEGNQEPVSDFMMDLGFQGMGKQQIQENREILDDSGPISILTPWFVLLNRIKNVLTIPGKNSENGLDQLRNAMAVCRCEIRSLLEDPEGKPSARRAAHKRHNAIVKLALAKEGRDLYKRYGIDLLEASPTENSGWPEKFIKEGWPRQHYAVQKRRKNK